MRRLQRTQGGFTLAEVMITLLIMGFALIAIIQGLNTSKFIAAHTHNTKVARNLALLTLGRVEAGLYWEEIDDRLFGTYAEDGYPAFEWEIAVGEDSLSDFSSGEQTLEHDSWYEDPYDDDDEDDEEAEEPYEQVRIRVTFPRLGEQPNEYVLERWIPWTQVYGEDEEEGSGSADDAATGG